MPMCGLDFRQERMTVAVTRVWNAIIDLPVQGGSAQAAHSHYTRPFPSWRKRSGYTSLHRPYGVYMLAVCTPHRTYIPPHLL